ncbi:MAG: exosome complex exonuclease Rrp41 [Candidatus Micrarchaeales archaeon]|jgi:exosome complex component RRP41|uniref:3' exoribonuclease n=1 Tax=Candidatus Micrarchaeum acidiphilum ARMAN-2 TaxID=425595 RepID=C7DI01_MICA2|nr:MAG: 3' exoribonuclease [Candidatus Micrarchaeum acidiphilum ARMAN-2]MCW6160822.1 exosome complex exonuclease Rrp41 [Candidatus Micrarchaeales archaeon]
MGSSSNKPQLIVDGKRLDGRDFNELRPLKIEAGILANANGSAYLEWGNNKVLAAVYGPKEATPRHLADTNKAIIKCRYSMAPFSSMGDHGRSGPNRRAIEISKVTKEVFENVVMLEEFPGSEIEIFIEILQSDGGTRAAGITAAAVALANAGIHVKDMVYAVSAGRIDEHVVIDVNMIEDNYSDADMPVSISPKDNSVLLLQMDGGFTKEQFGEAMKMILESGKVISKVQRDALKRLYENAEKGGA